jgi:hypothetical protein
MTLRPMDALLARKCPICGQTMQINAPTEFARTLREHSKVAHPEYYNFTRHIQRNLGLVLVAVVIFGFGPIFLLEPILGYVRTVILSVIGFIIPLAVLGIIGRRAINRSKQLWMQTHPIQSTADNKVSSEFAFQTTEQFVQSSIAPSDENLLTMPMMLLRNWIFLMSAFIRYCGRIIITHVEREDQRGRS